MKLVKKNEALYRTMHNTFPAYRNNNQGIIRLRHWIHWLKERPASLLDVGCGNGKLCKLLSDMGYDITGLDIVEGPYDRKDYNFIKHDIQLGWLPFKDKEFDICLSFDVLEHLHIRWSYHHIWDMLRVSDEVIGTIACFEHDPLHTNVKTPEEWQEIISNIGEAEFKVFEEQKGKTLLFFAKKKEN